MAVFYKGAGVGTWWHGHDPWRSGFTAEASASVISPSSGRLMEHIAKGITTSPYISLTRSYAVAWHYAMYTGKQPATRTRPGYIYVVEIDEDTARAANVILLDPVKEIAQAASDVLDPTTYHHDGYPRFLLGVVNPKRFARYLNEPTIHRSGRNPPIQRKTYLSLELHAIVWALRDAEILAVENIPAGYVKERIDVPS